MRFELMCFTVWSTFACVIAKQDQTTINLQSSSPSFSVGDTAIFQVVVQDINHIVWYLNDTNIQEIITIDGETFLTYTSDNFLKGTLAIPVKEGSQEWLNNTAVFCICLNTQTNLVLKSTTATLLLQGLLNAPTNISAHHINETVFIQWSPPYVLNGIVILDYHVSLIFLEKKGNNCFIYESCVQAETKAGTGKAGCTTYNATQDIFSFEDAINAIQLSVHEENLADLYLEYFHRCKLVLPLYHTDEYYKAVESGYTNSPSLITKMSSTTLNFTVSSPFCSNTTECEYITSVLTFQEVFKATSTPVLMSSPLAEPHMVAQQTDSPPTIAPTMTPSIESSEMAESVLLISLLVILCPLDVYLLYTAITMGVFLVSSIKTKNMC